MRTNACNVAEETAAAMQPAEQPAERAQLHMYTKQAKRVSKWQTMYPNPTRTSSAACLCNVVVPSYTATTVNKPYAQPVQTTLESKGS